MEARKLSNKYEKKFSELMEKFKGNEDFLELLELYPLIVSKELGGLSDEKIKSYYLKVQGVVEFRELFVED